jgi:hypothetical protein
MKKRTIFIILVLFVMQGVKAQDQSVIFKREFAFPDQSDTNTLIVANINGSVRVEGYTGEKILVEVESRRNHDSKAPDYPRGNVTAGYIDRGDTLIIYIEGLCNTFGKSRDHRNHGHSEWGYNYERCSDEQGWTRNDNYDYEMNFLVRVPKMTNLIISTINKGDLIIAGSSGAVIADNINGNVKIDHATGATNVSTINGNVDLNYDSNPSMDCRYYSLNGDIRADFPSGLAARLSFKTFNGDFYTNLDDLVLLPVAVEKTADTRGIHFKLDGNRYSIREGSVNLFFETFNGNVYVKEKN